MPTSRRTVLTILMVALIPAFATTHTVVAHYKDRRDALAREWEQRGDAALQHDDAAAVTDYETALSYGPDDGDTRFKLARALIGVRRLAEAKSQLITLWTATPGDGPINLQLARLDASANDVDEAVRYYHAAIDGAWESSATVARRNARIELAKLLLSKGQNSRAQAEVIAMLDDLPRDPSLMTDVAGLLVEAGADGRALTLLQSTLTLDPHNRRAALLAGSVVYRQGNYRLARRYLTDAAAAAPLDAANAEMLDVSGRVLSMDPDARRIGTRERARRATEDLAVAGTRLDRCTSDAVADLRTRLAPFARLGERGFVRDPDSIDDAMAVVYEIANLPAAACGDPTPADRALQILAGERRTQPR